jgi:hypothetical protein
VVAADIESFGLGGRFADAATYEGTETVYHKQPSSILEYFLTKRFRSGYLLFHNLEYDIRYLLNPLYKLTQQGYQVEGILRGNRKFVAVVITKAKNRWTIVDTYALFAAPLKALAVFSGEAKHDIGLGDGVIYDPTNPEHREYLAADVRILYHAYIRYAEILYDLFQIRPSLTAGSTAIRALSRLLDVPVRRQLPHVEAFAREGYFGGLTFIRYVRPFENASQIDARGMYAWAMRNPLPYGTASYRTRYDENHLGIYRVRVNSPRTIPFTFVPLRQKTGVCWPWGTFETVLTSPTIEFALEHGYDITVLEGYVFPETFDMLGTFVDRCESLELANKGNAIGAAIKILRNSLYGKFAQKGDGEKVIFGQMGEEPLIDEYTGEFIPAEFTAESADREYIHPEWAAFITAYARNNLARAVYLTGPDETVIGDTDSLVYVPPGDATPVLGPRYGDYKLERTYLRIIPRAPKVYAGYDEEGRPIIKCKGIPRSYLSVEDVESGERPVTFTMVPSAWRVIKGAPFSMEITRHLSDIHNSHSWVLDGDRVLPITVSL